MDIFKKLGVPVDEIEFGVKILFQSTIVLVGFLGNIHTIGCVIARSKLPRATNIFIISLSVALMLQTFNASIDYSNHLNNKEEYVWGHTACDTWNTLNVYLPMLLALHCFCCLLDRYVLLTQPHRHDQLMNNWSVIGMLLVIYAVPAIVTVPPIYFGWYTTEQDIMFRTEKDCKFRTNLKYALISPIITFWFPLIFNAVIIVKLFRTMEEQDKTMLLATGSSTEKLKDADKHNEIPWKENELRRQHRLAITLWSVYWNVTLFWIPHHAWQFIYKVTEADWPRATNFMAWAGYLPSLIIPALYRYYNIYQL